MRPRLTRRNFDATGTGALDGVRVIDLSRLVAGNLLSKVLADHGAEVIKVEPPQGDTLRAWKVEGVETAWKTWSRNKKSIALQLRHPAAQDIVCKLAANASIFVESFRPGVLEAMNLSPQRLLEANPKLVIVRLSGWGQTGQYREKPGFGTLAEAYSGFAASNGFADREPLLPPMFMADSFAGLYGATAAMAALHAADGKYGLGQVVDLALIDPILEVLEPQIANFHLSGSVKPRTGSRSTNTAPRNVFQTQDGRWVALSTATQNMAERLFRSIGRPELIRDPKFRDNSARLVNVVELDHIISQFVGSRSLTDNLHHFHSAGVTIGPVMDASDLAGDQYLLERESLVEIPDRDLGWITTHSPSGRLSGTPARFFRAAPDFGEHNDEVILPLIGEDEYTSLKQSGIVCIERT